VARCFSQTYSKNNDKNTAVSAQKSDLKNFMGLTKAKNTKFCDDSKFVKNPEATYKGQNRNFEN